MSDDRKADVVPVSVITGFLGAGKTTLLSRLVRDPMLSNAAVIINELGEIGLDHALVEKADGDIVEIPSGCLCCTVSSDLGETLLSLMERRDSGEIKAFDRVVIETTGLADPAPILHTLMRDPSLLARYRLEGVIAVVDAFHGGSTLDAYEEAVKQVAVADRIVLTKADLMVGREGEENLHAIVRRLRKLNPSARMLDTHSGEPTGARLFNTGLYDPDTKSVNVSRWLADEAYAEKTGRPRGRRGAHDHSHDHDANHAHDHEHHRHDDHIKSFSFATEQAISPQGLELFLELLQSYHGPNLLRFKAIVKMADDPNRPVVLHGVQHVLHPPHRLAAWPDADRRSRLVFITRDIAKADIEKLYAAFVDPLTGSGAAAADTTLSIRPTGSTAG
ncbi:MAG: GTP-binding protein [Hyphomicrobiales bacterium]